MPRMRTAAKALELIKQDDPGTDITLRYIRRLINSGDIPYTPVGTKKLINVDLLISHIATGKRATVEEQPKTGQIRPVDV